MQHSIHYCILSLSGQTNRLYDGFRDKLIDLQMKPFIQKMAVIGVVLFGVSSAGRSQEFDYASYTQTTLQAIIAEEQNHSQSQAETKKYRDYYQLECRVSKYQVSCCYSGIRRPISEKKKKVIRMWLETLRIDSRFASLYQQEIRVTKSGRTHWIPIQEQLFPCIHQELVKNDAIELFVLFIGKVENEFVFIATEFEKAIPPVQKSIQTAAYTSTEP